ncbi:hypothetical protein [Cellvibrio sp. QJXJ]|uniref:hypothetical protein n=1 Tax=Cellvibrio sp. QJXJ TaxID=2964606 RepID=UPI0021C26B9B|nr:hypothetical protein [Cellvibrio sp. QJXJ]UUA72566.1 hypothetical protein NNX04_19445 [Cellvibrio sp. QJXJ]
MKIKKMELITLVIAIVLLNSLFVNSANANNCDGLQYQVNYADWKLRQGGNSSYMKYWRQSRDGADKRLSQCKKSLGIGGPQIHVYTGENKGQAQNNNFVKSDINDPTLQQLIKTCNYWISEYNRNSSPENLAFRDNSCRDVKLATDRITNPPKNFLMIYKRSAKECIKPNNVIDKEVREYIEGLREPYWRGSLKTAK